MGGGWSQGRGRFGFFSAPRTVANWSGANHRLGCAEHQPLKPSRDRVLALQIPDFMLKSGKPFGGLNG